MKHLATKMAKIVGLMEESIKMTGWNNHQKFAYMREKDIVDTIRGILSKHNVALFTSLESSHKEGDLTTVTLKHILIDGDSGETLELFSSGTGSDKTQFGIFKAITGSFKFFLMKNFLVSGDDSDPENDGPVKETPATTSKPKDFPKPETKVEAPKEVKPTSGKGLLSKQAEAKTEAPKKPSFGNKKLATEPVKEETEEDAAF